MSSCSAKPGQLTPCQHCPDVLLSIGQSIGLLEGICLSCIGHSTPSIARRPLIWCDGLCLLHVPHARPCSCNTTSRCCFLLVPWCQDNITCFNTFI